MTVSFLATPFSRSIPTGARATRRLVSTSSASSASSQPTNVSSPDDQPRHHHHHHHHHPRQLHPRPMSWSSLKVDALDERACFPSPVHPPWIAFGYSDQQQHHHAASVINGKVLTGPKSLNGGLASNKGIKWSDLNIISERAEEP